MFRVLTLSIATVLACHAAELNFDFSRVPLDQLPPGFRSTVSGGGKPGDWRIILDEAPPASTPGSAASASPQKQPVLAQLSQDPADEHFPMLVYENEIFGDFTFTTKFKTVSGKVEQMAGVAFRIQDEKNYYYVRASSLGNTFRFFKLVNGLRSAPIGPEIQIASKTWHEMTVECRGNQIRCLLNGKDVIPTMTDSSFNAGKIAFWTKSDSVAYFASPRIVFTPRETLAKSLVLEAMQRYPRILSLRVYTLKDGDEHPKVVASNNEKDLGLAGRNIELDVIKKDSVLHGKTAQTVAITMPLHDRNGDTVAAVRVEMRSFRGQTEENAVARAEPIVRLMESRLKTSNERFE